MKVIAENENNKYVKIDVYKTLNDVPYTLNYHLLRIKEEIDVIVKILNEFDSLKKVFNNEKFNIQNYIDDFLNGIKSQALLLHKENKVVSREIAKNPKMGVLEEKFIEPKEKLNDSYSYNDNDDNYGELKSKAKGITIIKPKDNKSDIVGVNLNRNPVNATDLYDMQYLEDLRRAEEE